MSIPVMVLLGFAAWTVPILVGGIGIYRWLLLSAGPRLRNGEPTFLRAATGTSVLCARI